MTTTSPVQRGPHPAAEGAPRLVKLQAPEIVMGPGALAEAGYAAARLGGRRPFLVTDPGLVEEASIPRLAHTTLDDVCLTTNPRDADADDVCSLLRAAL